MIAIPRLRACRRAARNDNRVFQLFTAARHSNNYKPTTTVRTVGQMVANVAHTNLHYGNLITYIRMLGLTPPIQLNATRMQPFPGGLSLTTRVMRTTADASLVPLQMAT